MHWNSVTESESQAQQNQIADRPSAMAY